MSARWPPDLLAGEVAVVTGAGRGIGLAIASELVRTGARVAMFEREGERLAAALEEVRELAPPGTVVGAPVDIRHATEVAAALQLVRAELGDVSVLVNNAGITRDAYLRRMTYEQFDEVLEVHLRGAFTMVKECLESMIAVGHGAIVNMASSTGPYGNPGQANYGAAKAGIIGLTRTAAVELARFSIRANAIAPGAIDTPMMRAVGDEKLQGFVDLIPMRRLGDPSEVAHAAVFLASPLATYITGHVLFVDGGFTVAG
jgi:NAD(P)-dependent dehydrogenase (short-subunit alcohol dehydrogenase family)